MQFSVLATVLLSVNALQLASAAAIHGRAANPQNGLIVSPTAGTTYQTCKNLLNVTITNIPSDTAAITLQLSTNDKVPQTRGFNGDIFFPAQGKVSEQVPFPFDQGSLNGTWSFSVLEIFYNCKTKSSSTRPGPNVEINIVDNGRDSSQC